MRRKQIRPQRAGDGCRLRCIPKQKNRRSTCRAVLDRPALAAFVKRPQAELQIGAEGLVLPDRIDRQEKFSAKQYFKCVDGRSSGIERAVLKGLSQVTEHRCEPIRDFADRKGGAYRPPPGIVSLHWSPSPRRTLKPSLNLGPVDCFRAVVFLRWSYGPDQSVHGSVRCFVARCIALICARGLRVYL